MDKNPNLEYRMYGLVPYNISPIQQGIQYGHAVVEYILEQVLEKIMNGEEIDKEKIRALYNWAKYDKTFIILNGGTTNYNEGYLGTLNAHMETLKQMEIEYAHFVEPDLGAQLTAVVFLVDERVWDKEKYPDPPKWPEYPLCDLLTEEHVRELNESTNSAIYKMGGKEVWQFRQFLSQFKFA